MTRLVGKEFSQLFRSFEFTAFRLETRDYYDSSNERRALVQFAANEPVDLDWFQGWLSIIRQATADGRRFTRVRIVSVPFTDYTRFGLLCSQHTTAAGEDIRYLTRDQADGLPTHDYWLFDSRMLVRMHFDDQEKFLGGEVIEDPSVVVQHSYWRDMAWHRASRRDDFASTQRE